jgi:prepilin-type processing-associated H-X9-DG protein
MPRAREGRGFTLVEMLVITAVMALLFALLTPALGRALQRGRAVACLENLRQWGLAATAYADEHNGYLPRRGQGVQPVTIVNRPEDWFNALPPYVNEPSYMAGFASGRTLRAGQRCLLVCPAATNNPSGPHFFSYAMNMQLSPWNQPYPQRLTRIARPSAVVLLADAPGPYSSTLPTALPYDVSARHTEAAHLVFLDGHCAAFAGRYVGCGVGDPLREDIWWNPER